jgi:hypothetical protein
MPTTHAVAEASDPPEKPTAVDLRAFVIRSIALANEEAAKLEKSPIVEVAEYARAMYFVPKPVGDVPHGSLESSPPEGAQSKQWTDRYALAQRYSARLALDSIGTILPPPKDSSLGPSAVVTIRITGKTAYAVAKDEQPIPVCPDGMELWHGVDVRGIWGYGGWRRGLGWLTPPEKAVEAAKAKDSLATAALKMLESEPSSDIGGTYRLRAQYVPERRQWGYKIDAERKNLPRPETLDWKRFPRHEDVYDPSHFRR